MKRFFLFTTLFFLCLVMGFSAHATDVGGLITGDTTWTKANSPYVVISNVTVIEDVTLTIEPGVEVRFNQNLALIIDGTLIARGTESENITFTSDGSQTPGYWGYILFTDTSADATFDPDGNYTGGCIIQYAIVEYGGSGKYAITTNLSSPFIDKSVVANNNGGIYVNGDSPVISSSEIKDNSASFYGSGIYVSSGAPIVKNSTISGNSAYSYGGGIYAYSNSTVTVENSTISGNSAYSYGGGIYAYSNSTVTIQDSTISGNSAGAGGGIFATSSTVTIQNNTISGNSTNNGSGGGIYAEASTVTITGNRITQNTASSSLCLYNLEAGSVIGGQPEDANVIKDNNGDGVYISGTVPINYNDIYNNTGYSLVCGNSAGSPDIDATNNYWGTDKEAVVKALIWDGLDDASLGFVNYNPFSTVPFKPDDVIPPAAVTDLATSDPTANSITLTWTAPGDDGNEGQAKTYDIRYSTSEITDDNWDAATQCTGEPMPKPAGEPETFTVTDLSPGTTYYFAMKTADEVPNWSELSNVVQGTTSGGDTGAIDGRVTDKDTGNPIKFAIVIAIQKPAKTIVFTGKDGYYEIKDLQAGTWLVICIKKGYKAGIAKVKVEAGKTTTKDFELGPKSAGDDEDEFTDLYANYPNPFNPDTWIPYYLSQDADVTIRIYNSAGQLVRTLGLGRQVAGVYMDKDKAAYWNGKDDLGQQVASGVYYYTLRAGDFSATRKMIILK